MQEIVEFERRIVAALSRIDQGIGRLDDAHGAALIKARAGVAELLANQAAQEAAAKAEADALIKAAQTEAEVLRADAQGALDHARSLREKAEIEAQDEPTLARMRERLAVSREREADLQAQYNAEIQLLQSQLEDQALELARLQRALETLRGELAKMTDATLAGEVAPQLINRAMLAELEALRAARAAERAELADISTALEAKLAKVSDA